MWIGFLAVAFTDEPSPNDQDHEVGLLVEVSVKVTLSGAVPDIWVPVKAATGFTGAAATGFTGAAVTVIYFVRVKVLLPAAFLAVNATV